VQNWPIFTINLNWVPIVGAIAAATAFVLKAIHALVAPMQRLSRQHETLMLDYNIRTECADVPLEKETGMRDANEFYRRHPLK